MRREATERATLEMSQDGCDPLPVWASYGGFSPGLYQASYTNRSTEPSERLPPCLRASVVDSFSVAIVVAIVTEAVTIVAEVVAVVAEAVVVAVEVTMVLVMAAVAVLVSIPPGLSWRHVVSVPAYLLALSPSLRSAGIRPVGGADRRRRALRTPPAVRLICGGVVLCGVTVGTPAVVLAVLVVRCLALG